MQQSVTAFVWPPGPKSSTYDYIKSMEGRFTMTTLADTGCILHRKCSLQSLCGFVFLWFVALSWYFKVKCKGFLTSLPINVPKFTVAAFKCTKSVFNLMFHDAIQYWRDFGEN